MGRIPHPEGDGCWRVRDVCRGDEFRDSARAGSRGGKQPYDERAKSSSAFEECLDRYTFTRHRSGVIVVVACVLLIGDGIWVMVLITLPFTNTGQCRFAPSLMPRPTRSFKPCRQGPALLRTKMQEGRTRFELSTLTTAVIARASQSNGLAFVVI
jgi:hypothetical protein